MGCTKFDTFFGNIIPVEEEMVYKESVEYCSKLGGKLASITSNERLKYLSKHKFYGCNKNLRVGLDWQNGQPDKWVDGQEFNEKWFNDHTATKSRFERSWSPNIASSCKDITFNVQSSKFMFEDCGNRPFMCLVQQQTKTSMDWTPIVKGSTWGGSIFILLLIIVNIYFNETRSKKQRPDMEATEVPVVYQPPVDVSRSTLSITDELADHSSSHSPRQNDNAATVQKNRKERVATSQIISRSGQSNQHRAMEHTGENSRTSNYSYSSLRQENSTLVSIEMNDEYEHLQLESSSRRKSDKTSSSVSTDEGREYDHLQLGTSSRQKTDKTSSSVSTDEGREYDHLQLESSSRQKSDKISSSVFTDSYGGYHHLHTTRGEIDAPSKPPVQKIKNGQQRDSPVSVLPLPVFIPLGVNVKKRLPLVSTGQDAHRPKHLESSSRRREDETSKPPVQKNKNENVAHSAPRIEKNPNRSMNMKEEASNFQTAPTVHRQHKDSWVFVPPTYF